MKKNKDILSQIEKRKRPEIPVDYFEELNTKLLHQIQQEPIAKVVPLKKLRFFWISSAAAAILVLISVYATRSIPLSDELTFSALTNTEIENYIHLNLEDFDEDLIVEVLKDNPIESAIVDDTTKKTQPTKKEVLVVQPNEKSNNVSFENLTREDILNYLKQQELTEEELEEEINN